MGWQSATVENGTVKENDSSSRIENVQRRIRILKDASIKNVYEICSRERFTHVHILAHGGTFEDAGNSDLV